MGCHLGYVKVQLLNRVPSKSHQVSVFIITSPVGGKDDEIKYGGKPSAKFFRQQTTDGQLM